MKLSRKWILVAALVMSVAMATSGTLAYLTDRDSETNVFTFGNVDIELNEEFEQGAQLIPGKDINKLPTIENTGKTSAWVWMTLSIPAELDVPTSASDNVIHWNWTGATDAAILSETSLQKAHENGWISEDITMDMIKANNWTWDMSGDAYETEIGGKAYHSYDLLYNAQLAPGEKTLPGIVKVYMDPHIDIDPEGNLHHVQNGNVTDIEWNIYKDNAPTIYIAAYAIQTEGFENVDLAYAAYATQWGKNGGGVEYDTPVLVTNEDDMYAALDKGETDLIVKGVTITENNFNGHYYKDRNIVFADCTFKATMDYMYINNVTFTTCTFDSGSANAAVHYDELFGDALFDGCTFKSGKIQIGANKDVTGTVTFNECTFEPTTQTHSIWSEMGIRVYSPATFNACEFNNRVVMAGANDLPISFDTCTMNGGTAITVETDIIRGGNVPVVTIK